MMRKIVIFICAIVIANEASAGEYSLGNILLDSTSLMSGRSKLFREAADNPCTVAGNTCKNCTHLQVCVDIGGPELMSFINDCKGIQTCNVNICSDTPSAECRAAGNPDYEFKCYVPGLFPDPFDCTKYYLCTEADKIIETPTEFTCKGGFAYDSLTTLCSKKQTKDCGLLKDECTSLGDNGPVPNNRNMYYVCLFKTEGDKRVLMPQLFNCANGMQYIEYETGKYKCTESLPPWDDSEIDTLGKCKNNQMYYDIVDCKKYHECKKGEDVKSTNCAPEYFDKWAGKCVEFKC